MKLCIPNLRERFPLLCQGKEPFVWTGPPIAVRRCRKLQAECGKLSGAKTQIAAFSDGLDVSGEHDLGERMYHCLPRVWYLSLGCDSVRDSTKPLTVLNLTFKGCNFYSQFFPSFPCWAAWAKYSLQHQGSPCRGRPVPAHPQWGTSSFPSTAHSSPTTCWEKEEG